MTPTIRLTFKRAEGSSSSYLEQPEDRTETVIGQLIFRASALRELGDPDVLVVTIKPAGRDQP